MSCASAGNCSAGGYYFEGSPAEHDQAFVVSETNGTWQKAKDVPGIDTLSRFQGGAAGSVSCASVGNCSAGGAYVIGLNNALQLFVVSEVNGRWQKAKEMPGIAALNVGQHAQILSLSCASMGNCSAGGYYEDGGFHPQAFVVSEINGTWQKAEEVPGSAALNKGGNAEINSVSCATASSCGAGGSYQPDSNTIHSQAFIVNRT